MRTLLTLSVISILLFSTSCGKRKKISEEDAVDYIAYTLSQNGDGIAKQSSDIAKDMSQVISFLPCGATKDTTVHFTISGAISADFTFVRHYELVCSTDTSIICSGTNTGYFENNKLKINNSSTRQWTTTGIGVNYSNYTFNGTSSGGGTWISKVRREKTINTDWTIVNTNVIIDKTTRKITSGSGTFNLSCSVVDGNDYTYSGTITYNGNGSATIVINGNTYTVQIY
ncbi:MAG: hypothetical protein EP305_12715 [Bacteroidetes bacterium]|nr:MAG: hypothetical protein EP305_12715 [Bacteroidota bacterium]